MLSWDSGTWKSFKLQRHLNSPGIFEDFNWYVSTALSELVSESIQALNLSIPEYENRPLSKEVSFRKG